MSQSHHPPRVFPSSGSRKRKEREDFDGFKLEAPMEAEPANDNRLLAGYLAHEFLTEGTLLGERWDPVRTEAAPISGRVEPRVVESTCKHKRYGDVANLLKNDGARVPGIVNPTELARWLRM